MRRNHYEENGDSTGGQDLFMNCFLAMLILMFVFMLNQGVKAVSQQADDALLVQLLEEQQAEIEKAAENAQNIGSELKYEQQQRAEDKKKNQKKWNAAHEKYVQQKGEWQKDKQKSEEKMKNSVETIRNLEKQLETATQVATAAREADSLRIDISHDTTASMSKTIGHTKYTAGSMARTLPEVLKSVEIGLIQFGNKRLVSSPIQAVKSVAEDGGISIKQLNGAMEKMKANGGGANITEAIRASMQRMDQAAGSPREIMVVIGDVGPAELHADNPEVAEQLLGDVQRWCETSGKNRRVLALYTGRTGNVHEQFFKQLGASNVDSMFSTQDAQMFELVIKAAFTQED